MKILPVGGESFHADRGTDVRMDYEHDEIIVAFRNFVNAPKISAVQTTSNARHCTFHRVKLFAIELCASPFAVFVIGCDVL